MSGKLQLALYLGKDEKSPYTRYLYRLEPSDDPTTWSTITCAAPPKDPKANNGFVVLEARGEGSGQYHWPVELSALRVCEPPTRPWKCCECGGKNVQERRWYAINKDEVLGDCGDEDYWCDDCEAHVDIEEDEG